MLALLVGTAWRCSGWRRRELTVAMPWPWPGVLAALLAAGPRGRSRLRRVRWSPSTSAMEVAAGTRPETRGTESAFAVLARARALEARGRGSCTWRSASRDFPTPAHVGRRPRALSATGETGYGPAAGLPELRAAAARARWPPRAGSGGTRGACWSAPARSRSCSSPCWRRASPATRWCCPIRLPDLRHRRSAGPARRRCPAPEHEDAGGGRSARARSS